MSRTSLPPSGPAFSPFSPFSPTGFVSRRRRLLPRFAVLAALFAGAGAWMVRGHGQTTEATRISQQPSAIPQPRTDSDPSAVSPPLNTARTVSKTTDIHLLADEDYAPAIERLLSEAKTSIDVTMFSCVLPDQASAKHPVRRLLDCLVAQHRAGVTVRVVFDQGAPVGRTNDDREPPSRNAGRYLKSAGVDIRWDEDRRTTHTKSLTVDGRWCVVGSTNWSASALAHNREQSLLVDSPALASELTAHFNRLWAIGRPVE